MLEELPQEKLSIAANRVARFKVLKAELDGELARILPIFEAFKKKIKANI